MKVAALQRRLDSVENQYRRKESSRFSITSGEKGETHLKFATHSVTLPLVPYRPYQQELVEAFTRGITRFFIVWPRRAGKEFSTWNFLVQRALESPGLYLMIYPTNVAARGIIWEGDITLPNGQSLRFLDMIPEKLIKRRNNQEMKLELYNGSVINCLGSDSNINKLRGRNPRGIVFSEYAFSDPQVYRILMPAVRQNKGWIILQTTFDGMNHAYQYMMEVKNNSEWFTRIESVDTLVDENNKPYVTKEMIDEDRQSGMPEWLIQQEYYSVVSRNEDSMYFAVAMNYCEKEKKIGDNIMLANRVVHCAYDIGYNDATAVVFFQMDENNKPVVINYEENSGKNLGFYLEKVKAFCTHHQLPMGVQFFPHDGKKREFGTGLDVPTLCQQQGIKSEIVERTTSKYMAIQSMRKQLYNTRFEKQNTKRLIECLSNYSKEFDKKRGIYKEAPLHNWASHGVDSFQTMTLALERGMVRPPIQEILYYNR